MRYLLISFCFLIVGCASYPAKNNFTEASNSSVKITNPYFSNASKDYIYKAEIAVRGKKIGGIFIVKKIGEFEHRVVFTTEMGVKIFDFSFINNTFKVNFILKELNNKLLINLLKKDFKTLIDPNPKQLNSYKVDGFTIMQTETYQQLLYYFKKENRLEKIVWTKHQKEIGRIIFSEVNDNIAKNIQILHTSIKLEINLKII